MNKSTKAKHSQCHEVFSFLLSLLDLRPEHRDQLNARGFSDEEIETAQFKSFPYQRANLAQTVAKKFMGNLFGVPGFFTTTRDKWDIAGKAGLLLPIRNRSGEIMQLKSRVDKPANPSQKYCLLSSNPKADPKTGEVNFPNGTTAKPMIHFPLGCPAKLDVLRITEGEFKAEICCLYTPIYTIALPGAAFWQLAIPAVEELKPGRVLLAFDKDKTEPANENTSRAYGGKDYE
jgi:hypothetical protein